MTSKVSKAQITKLIKNDDIAIDKALSQGFLLRCCRLQKEADYILAPLIVIALIAGNASFANMRQTYCPL